jgi:putative transposase
VAVTATFRLLYVFVVIEHGSRYLIRDRDSIFARSLDESIRNLGLTAFKSPPHSPKANAICERVIGTVRRECLAVSARSVLGGLHHEYLLAPVLA